MAKAIVHAYTDSPNVGNSTLSATKLSEVAEVRRAFDHFSRELTGLSVYGPKPRNPNAALRIDPAYSDAQSLWSFSLWEIFFSRPTLLHRLRSSHRISRPWCHSTRTTSWPSCRDGHTDRRCELEPPAVGFAPWLRLAKRSFAEVSSAARLACRWAFSLGCFWAA